jgi:hypothetical protein
MAAKKTAVKAPFQEVVDEYKSFETSTMSPRFNPFSTNPSLKPIAIASKNPL